MRAQSGRSGKSEDSIGEKVVSLYGVRGCNWCKHMVHLACWFSDVKVQKVALQNERIPTTVPYERVPSGCVPEAVLPCEGPGDKEQAQAQDRSLHSRNAKRRPDHLCA